MKLNGSLMGADIYYIKKLIFLLSWRKISSIKVLKLLLKGRIITDMMELHFGYHFCLIRYRNRNNLAEELIPQTVVVEHFDTPDRRCRAF